MEDIFDTKIVCRKCNIEMNKVEMEKNGIKVRAVECGKCKERIVHPEDKKNLEHFKDLKGKTYSVKLRVVGNSHAVSIPKEIVDFMNGINRNHDDIHKRMRKEFDDMNKIVRLCFEDFGRISLRFNNMYNEEEESLNDSDDNEDRIHKDSEDLRKIAINRYKESQGMNKNKEKKKNEERR